MLSIVIVSRYGPLPGRPNAGSPRSEISGTRSRRRTSGRFFPIPTLSNISATQFDALHQGWCSSICSSLSARQVSKVTHGRAAKVVAVYLKAVVLMGDRSDSRLGRNMHPPIDRTLLQSLAASDQITSPHKAAWRSVSWTQLDRAGYDVRISQLRGTIPAGAPFWTIEEHWEPSDREDDAL